MAPTFDTPVDSRADALRLDAADPLAPMRERFVLPEGVVYLDGNSLGPLPRATREAVLATIEHAWGHELIRAWNSAGWIDLPERCGDAIGELVGAAPGSVVVGDSTSVNLFKVLAAALRLQADRPAERRVILSEAGNFPTDLYIAQGLTTLLDRGWTLQLVERDALEAAIDDTVAVTMLTQVDYRTGSRLDMRALSDRAHAVGALAIWDLAHSAGAFPVALDDDGVDMAVGCGYKYLNGGPGAPAFVYVAGRLRDAVSQPLSGWLGHAAPFAFETGYVPAPGVRRMLCGTPPVLSMVALEAGVATLLEARACGGLPALRAKSLALSDLFIARALARGARHGLRCVTPAEHAHRGSQASFTLPDGDQAYAVVQALIARGVIGDFRAPDILRFGFAPAYLRFADVWDAAEALGDVLDARAWDDPRFLQRKAVT